MVNNEKKNNEDKNKKRPSTNNKYNLNDNRRDLLLPNFDRTLTVEKQHFENNEEPLTHSFSTPTQHIPPKNDLDDTPVPSISTPSLSNKRSIVKNDASQSNMNIPNRNNNRKILKKQSKSTMPGAASPAEVFHRNLVDAVSNVEDSDENEHYVYPYSGNESLGTNGMHRPISIRSIPSSLLSSKKLSSGRKSFGDWLRKTLYKKSKNQVLPETAEEEDLYWSNNEQAYQRPRLRHTLRDRPSSESNPRSGLMTLWQESPLPFKALSKKPSSFSQRRLRYGQDGILGGGYTSDDEDAPLLSRRQKRISTKNKKSCPNRFQYILLLFVFMLISFFCILIYKAQPIANLSVDMARVLATDKELIFDLRVQADNWNWWTIHVADADISIFAFSQIVPATISQSDQSVSESGIIRGADPAEYLGSLTHFDEPLSLNPNLLNKKQSSESITQIRIRSPGADSSGNERWSRMIRYPYSLVIRGVLRYKLIPFVIGSYPQSIAICNVTQVDPTTGTVSGDLDKTICNGDETSVFSHAY